MGVHYLIAPLFNWEDIAHSELSTMGTADQLAKKYITHHLAPGLNHSINHYRLLGLRDNATVPEVDKKKRLLSLKFMPDKLDFNLLQFCQDVQEQHTEDHPVRLYTISCTTLLIVCTHVCVGSATFTVHVGHHGQDQGAADHMVYRVFESCI